MNYLARKIGFFYVTKEWKNKIFQGVVNGINPDAIKIVKDNTCETRIVLQDDTVTIFLKPNDSARGYRWHECFIEPEVAYRDYCDVIMPKLIHGGNAFVVEELKDIYFRKKSAYNHYRFKNEMELSENV